MFRKFGHDRRKGYSFVDHVRRVVATKGLMRVVTSLGGTVLVAALALAHCSSSDITGPKRSVNPPSGISKWGDGTTTTWLPPAYFGPLTVPITVIPPYSACTNQDIFWSPDK